MDVSSIMFVRFAWEGFAYFLSRSLRLWLRRGGDACLCDVLLDI